MPKLTLRGVFFVTRSSVRLNIWALCQQTQVAAKFRADDEIAKEVGVSGDTVRRYIRLTELSPPLQQMVDDKRIAVTPAVELSYLKPEEQAIVMEVIDSGQAIPTLTQAQRLKRSSQEGGLDRDVVLSILCADAPPPPTVRLPAQQKPPKPEKAETAEDTTPKRERTSHIAEDILRLKDTTKECRCTPEMFLSAFGEYVSRSRREMEVFLIPFYTEIFPALSPEHMAGLQRQINDIHAAADTFYNDVKGRNEHE